MTNLAAIIPRIPVTCFWEITDACNLRCIHCEASSGKRSRNELTTEEALALADDLAVVGCQSAMLTGGEPLVRRDWPRIAERLAGKGLDVTLITNGLLIDEARVSRMIEAGVTGVSVSLDGEKEVHDTIRVPALNTTGSTWEAAIHAIEQLVASPLKTAVITQVHKRNIDDLASMYETMVSLGIDVWQVQIAMPLGRLLDIRFEYLIEPSQIPGLETQLAEFVKDGRVSIAMADNIGYYSRLEPMLRGSHKGQSSFWTGCMAGCRVLAICSDGDVKGCPSHPKSFTVGNIRKTPLPQIWGDPKRFSYNTEWKEELLEGGCAECPYRRVCRAGCTTMAYAVTGTIYDNPFCVQRAIVDEATT
ncbi:MAG: radical SAM protein [Proteobacteria bacterium]|nr:radical SAM protein [Pseudomonadota bacterium]